MKDPTPDRRISHAQERLRNALSLNEDTGSVAMVGERVFVVAKGPSGNAEAIVYVDVNDLAVGCIYGHVRRTADGDFAAVMIQSHRFLSANCPVMLFRRFDYWVRVRLSFKTLRLPDGVSDRPPRGKTFEAAIRVLAEMISSYTVKQGWFEDDPTELAALDLDPLKIFPLDSAIDADGSVWQPPPATLRSIARKRPQMTTDEPLLDQILSD